MITSNSILALMALSISAHLALVGLKFMIRDNNSQSARDGILAGLHIIDPLFFL